MGALRYSFTAPGRAHIGGAKASVALATPGLPAGRRQPAASHGC